MPSNNIGSLLYESSVSSELINKLEACKREAQFIQSLLTSARIKTLEDGATERTIYIDQYSTPICKIYESPSFFVNRSTYQLTDSGNKYEMVACINTNMLDILVMKCIEVIRPITKIFSLLNMDCDYLNIPFEDGLEVFDSNKANWIKL